MVMMILVEAEGEILPEPEPAKGARPAHFWNIFSLNYFLAYSCLNVVKSGPLKIINCA